MIEQDLLRFVSLCEVCNQTICVTYGKRTCILAEHLTGETTSCFCSIGLRQKTKINPKKPEHEASLLFLSRGAILNRYESAKAQAIGWSRRHGQTRTVKVYHFLTGNTIVIDYLEAREKKFLYEICVKIQIKPKKPEHEASLLFLSWGAILNRYESAKAQAIAWSRRYD